MAGPAAVEQTAQVIQQTDELIAALRTVLENMLELETYNELLDLVRSILNQQQELLDKTETEQKRQARGTAGGLTGCRSPAHVPARGKNSGLYKTAESTKRKRYPGAGRPSACATRPKWAVWPRRRRNVFDRAAAHIARWGLFLCAVLGMLALPLFHSVRGAEPTEGSAENPAETPPVAVNASEQLADRQSQVADQFQRLEMLMLKMAEFDAGTNPQRSALLKQALTRSKDNQVSHQVTRVGQTATSGRTPTGSRRTSGRARSIGSDP